MEKNIHYVYYAIADNKEKIGVTQNIKVRFKKGNYDCIKILKAFYDAKQAGDKEIELQLKYFGKRDSNLHYVDTLKNIKKRNVSKLIKNGKNNIKNLEIAKIKGLHKKNNALKGELQSQSKLSEEQVIQIFNSNLTYQKISNIYNISTTRVYQIKKGICWKHLNLLNHA